MQSLKNVRFLMTEIFKLEPNFEEGKNEEILVSFAVTGAGYRL